MTNVVPLFAADDPGPTACGCCEHQPCYPHRLEQVATRLRAEVKALDDWLVLRSEVERMAADVLAALDDITAECLPNERANP